MVKAVIFDLDDTLISEYDYIMSGFNYVAEMLAKKYHSSASYIYEILIRLFKDNSKNVFNRLLDKLNIAYSNKDILSLVKEYRGHIPNISFYDDVMPLIDYLKVKNIKIGIITDGYIESQKRKLEKVNAYNLFDYIIITDELGKEFWKPHPKPFEMMKGFFGVEFDEMMYIGDNPEKDFYIGSIYPVTTVRIMREKSVYAKSRYKENIKETFMVVSLKELKYDIF